MSIYGRVRKMLWHRSDWFDSDCYSLADSLVVDVVQPVVGLFRRRTCGCALKVFEEVAL